MLLSLCIFLTLLSIGLILFMAYYGDKEVAQLFFLGSLGSPLIIPIATLFYWWIYFYESY